MLNFKVTKKQLPLYSDEHGNLTKTVFYVNDMIICETFKRREAFCTIDKHGAPSNIRNKYKNAYNTNWYVNNIETLFKHRPTKEDFKNSYPDLTWGNPGSMITIKGVKELLEKFHNKIQLDNSWSLPNKMKPKVYDLDFYKAFEIVMNGGAVKGNDFRDGIFLKLNSSGQLVTVDAARLYMEDTTVFLKGIARQKFREVKVLTMNELSD
jgi:hypothetical protein